MCIAAVFIIAPNCKQLKCPINWWRYRNKLYYHPYSRLLLSNKMEGTTVMQQHGWISVTHRVKETRCTKLCTVQFYYTFWKKQNLESQKSEIQNGAESWLQKGMGEFEGWWNCSISWLFWWLPDDTFVKTAELYFESSKFFFVYKLYLNFLMQKDKNKSNYFSYLMKPISKPDQCMFWGFESPRPKHNHKNKRKHWSHGGNFRTKIEKFDSTFILIFHLSSKIIYDGCKYYLN